MKARGADNGAEVFWFSSIAELKRPALGWAFLTVPTLEASPLYGIRLYGPCVDAQTGTSHVRASLQSTSEHIGWADVSLLLEIDKKRGGGADRLGIICVEMRDIGSPESCGDLARETKREVAELRP